MVQTLVEAAPFPGILAGQGRHDFARLVMQQLLQVREQCVKNCMWDSCHHWDSKTAWHLLLRPRGTQTPALIGPSTRYSVAYTCAWSLAALVRHTDWYSTVCLATCRPQPGGLYPFTARAQVRCP